MSRGRSEIYLKDEASLEEHLVTAGIASLAVEIAGETRSGADLGALVEHARRLRRLMAYVPHRYPAALVETMALAGAFDPDITDKAAAAAQLATHLNAGSSGWDVEVGAEGGYVIRYLDRGVTDVTILDRAFVTSAEARKLHALAAEQAALWQQPAILGGVTIRRPTALLDAVLEAGRKGLAVQRYKGLGEMNAEQLWETTLDPAARTLLRVEVRDAVLADETFTQLMGDIVEPRREFIQQNALSVANLDI